MAPIAYFFIIPAVIQNTINNTDMNSIKLNALDVNNFETVKVGFAVNAQVQPVFFFPLKAGIDSTEFHVVDETGNNLASAEIPSLEFVLNQEIVLDMSANISFANSNSQAFTTLVNQFSTVGLNQRKFQMRANVPIRVFGILVYRGLYIYKDIPVSGIQNNLLSVVNSIPPLAKIPTSSMSNSHILSLSRH